MTTVVTDYTVKQSPMTTVVTTMSKTVTYEYSCYLLYS